MSRTVCDHNVPVDMPCPQCEPEIAPKQVWEREGMPYWHVRIMGVVENYVMCRRKGCVPSVWHINDFKRCFTRVK